MSREGKTLPIVVRAVVLILLGVLAFVLGARLYAERNRPKPAAERPAKCCGCPLAEQCEKSTESAKER